MLTTTPLGYEVKFDPLVCYSTEPSVTNARWICAYIKVIGNAIAWDATRFASHKGSANITEIRIRARSGYAEVRFARVFNNVMYLELPLDYGSSVGIGKIAVNKSVQETMAELMYAVMADSSLTGYTEAPTMPPPHHIEKATRLLRDTIGADCRGLFIDIRATNWRLALQRRPGRQMGPPATRARPLVRSAGS